MRLACKLESCGNKLEMGWGTSICLEGGAWRTYFYNLMDPCTEPCSPHPPSSASSAKLGCPSCFTPVNECVVDGLLGLTLALRPLKLSLGIVGQREGTKNGKPGQLAAWVQSVIQAADMGVPLLCARSPAGR